MTYTPDQFQNTATSSLAVGGLTQGALTLTVQPGDGAKFSAAPPFVLAVGNLAGVYELLRCTAHGGGDSFTVVRGQEGTTAQAWAAGTPVQQVVTAGSLNDLWTAINSGRSYNVLDYGAKGDGLTDDTAAIQAAITACCNSGGGEVLFPDPAATYLISTTLTVTSDNVTLRGQGWGAQLLVAPGWTSGAYMLRVQGPGGSGNFRYGIRISELFFNGNNVAGAYGLDMVSTYAAYLDHLRIRFVRGINVHWNGISTAFGAYNYMTNCHITDGGDAAIGVQTDFSEWLTIQGSEFGFFNGSSGTAEAVRLQNFNCRILGTSFDHNDTAIHLSFAGRNIIDGCQFDRGYKYFVYSQGAKDSVISNNFFGVNNSAGADLLRFDSNTNARNVVIGNVVQTASNWGFFIHEYNGITGSNLYSNNQVDSIPSLYLTGRNGNGVYNVREFGAQGDGVADDTAAIQAALNSARTSGGGEVVLPAGTYLVSMNTNPNVPAFSQALYIGGNTTLRGAGRGATTIKLAAQNAIDQQYVIRNYNPQSSGATDTNITIRDLTVDGNAVNQTLSGALSAQGGIGIFYAAHLIVENVDSKNHIGSTNGTPGPSGQSGESLQLLAYHCVNVAFLNCEAYCDAGTIGSGIATSNSFDARIVNCAVHSTTFGLGFTNFRDSGLNISNCNAYATTDNGYLFEQSHHITLANCQAGGLTPNAGSPNPPFPINVYAGGVHNGFVLASCQAVTVDNCQVVNASLSGFLSGLSGSSTSQSSNILFNNCRVEHIAAHGWQVQDATGDVSLTNCEALACGQAQYQGGAAGNGFYFLTNSATGRYQLVNCRSNSHSLYGYRFDTNVPLGMSYMTQCVAQNNSAGAMRVQATIYSSLQGVQTAPAVPASGTAITSPFPMPSTVNVQGGQVTSVLVGGFSTGVTSGFVRVPAGLTVTLNYNTAPTWLWLTD